MGSDGFEENLDGERFCVVPVVDTVVVAVASKHPSRSDIYRVHTPLLRGKHRMFRGKHGIITKNMSVTERGSACARLMFIF